MRSPVTYEYVVPLQMITYTRNVPLVLIWCMRSNRFIGVASVPVKWIALALLTTMSIPPNCFTACSMEFWMLLSSRTSTMLGRACPPADSTAQSDTQYDKGPKDNTGRKKYLHLTPDHPSLVYYYVYIYFLDRIDSELHYMTA